MQLELSLSLKDLALLASKPLTDFEDKHLAKLKAKLVSDDFRKRPSRASYSEEENAVVFLTCVPIASLALSLT